MNVAERQKPQPGQLFLDHVAHFVPDLGAAAKLLRALGFAVTPESEHRAQGAPAGTSNRCVMLEEGYVEILAPTLDTPNARRVRERMERFVGVHLACFGTPDAQAEHRRLAAHGFDPEELVSLEREVDSGDGTAAVRFKVVYVPPDRMPEGRIQYVQQLTPEHIWTEHSLRHGNGVLGLAAVFVVADDPAETAARWARYAGLLPRVSGALVGLETARGRVFVGTAAELEKILGPVPPPPALAGYALACARPEAFAGRCLENGIEVNKTEFGHAAALPGSLGGVWLF